MNILITGVKGQLGHDVFRELVKRQQHDVLGIDIDDLNLREEIAVKIFFQSRRFGAIIHCAAYTAVDDAEGNEEICFDVNVNGTKYLLDQASKQNAKFIFISTDYVFDGNKPDEYNIDDEKKPNGVYGESKNIAENIVIEYNKAFIVRTSWVYGLHGKNFVKTMLNLAESKREISVVSDQIGSPTYSFDLAILLCDMIDTEKYGLYHATNEGFCSWNEFSKKIFNFVNSNIIIKPIATSDYPTKAKRPANSRLSKESLIENGFKKLPTWENALKRFLKEIGRI